MFHLHNPHMHGTRVDVMLGMAVVLFILFLIVMVVGPVRTLTQERDEVRTEHVRDLMTRLLQLELINPEAYEALVGEVRAQGDYRMVIGAGVSCGGSHGPECSDAVTADTCLHTDEYFSDLLLVAPPVDPRNNYYSQAVTGYYLAMHNGQLEVGSCGASQEPIVLRKATN